MKYFKDCKTAEDVKKTFHKLAMKLHPDNGGSAAEFVAMKAEFEKAFETLKNKHVNAEGKAYEKETTETAGEFADIIEKLIHVPGINIEICGSWLWVSGNTRDCKDLLKEMHFRWSKNKSSWYFHFEPYVKRNNKKYSLDDIRNMFGSESFATHPNLALEA